MDAQAQAAHERQRALAQISDHDSAYNSESWPPPSSPRPQSTIADLNFKVVHHWHPAVEKVLSLAPYATIYEFEQAPEWKWEKKEIEGPLFICQLTAGEYGEERFAAIVMNRKSLQSFEVALTENANAQVTINSPYIEISSTESGEQKMYGLYIHDKEGEAADSTRNFNGDLMVTLAAYAGHSRRLAEEAIADAHAQREDQTTQQAPAVFNSRQTASIPLAQEAGYVRGGRQRDDFDQSVRAEHGVVSPVLPSPPVTSNQSQNLLALFQTAPPQPSVAHHLEETGVQYSGVGQSSQTPTQPQYPVQNANGLHQTLPPTRQPQSDVLTDLFRRSGYLG